MSWPQPNPTWLRPHPEEVMDPNTLAELAEYFWQRSERLSRENERRLFDASGEAAHASGIVLRMIDRGLEVKGPDA